MKTISLKSFAISSLFLFASQLSAQESEPKYSKEGEGDDCWDFPECTHNGNAAVNEEEEESKWKLLWEKLTKETDDALESIPGPAKSE